MIKISHDLSFLKPVNFILLHETGFDPWVCLLYSIVVSFLCEGTFISICSSCVRGASYCLPSNLSKPCGTFKNYQMNFSYP